MEIDLFCVATLLAFFLISFFEEVKDISLILGFEVLGVGQHSISKFFTFLFRFVDGFINALFNAKTKHFDLMKAHVSMRYI